MKNCKVAATFAGYMISTMALAQGVPAIGPDPVEVFTTNS